jgi:hypothetical protein
MHRYVIVHIRRLSRFTGKHRSGFNHGICASSRALSARSSQLHGAQSAVNVAHRFRVPCAIA